jgi:nitroreductase
MSFVRLSFSPPSEQEVLASARTFREEMETRRSLRFFSDRPLSPEVLEDLLMTASSAPSGANKQPWKFVIVTNPALKKKIREAAEAEEKEFYERRAPEEWLEDLKPFGTDWEKKFLEVAPALIVVFKQLYEPHEDGKRKHYYVSESVGIACGFLIAAIHQAGLVTLTHTPSPMKFLEEILQRPAHEKAFLLLPVGYPAEDAEVPVLTKKSFEEVAEVF